MNHVFVQTKDDLSVWFIPEVTLIGGTDHCGQRRWLQSAHAESNMFYAAITDTIGILANRNLSDTFLTKSVIKISIANDFINDY